MVDVKKQDSKVLMMVALLSDYDLILVVQDGEKRDYISGIDCLFENCLELKRQFATSSYTDGVESIVPICENEFLCQIGIHTYTFIGLHKKLEYYDTEHNRTWQSILDVLGNVDYSKTNCYYNDGFTYLILTPESFGELTTKESFQIKNLINTYLDGNKAKYQVPRTIYFKVKTDYEKDQNIYAGIYDLGFKHPLNEIMILNRDLMMNFSEDNLRKCKMLLEHILVS